MAIALHGTTTASASARALAAFFGLYKAVADEDKQSGKGDGNQNPRNMFDKEKGNCHRITAPFIEALQLSFGFLCGLYQHEDDEGKGKRGCYNADDINIAKEKIAELVDDECYGVSEAALVENGKCCPFGAVHFAADGTHGGKARCAKQVENKERISTDRGESGGKIGVNRSGLCGIEDTHGANDIFFGKKTGEGGNRCLPRAEAQGGKDPREERANGGENALVEFFLRKHTEAFVGEAEISKEPDDNGGKQNHRACFFDKRPTSFPH